MGRSVDISSAYGAATVTPSDTGAIPGTRGIECSAGNLTVRHVNGDIIQHVIAAAGIFPYQVNRVYATGTTSTGIVALY